MNIDDQLEKELKVEVKRLTAKIVDHYQAIENFRQKDRELWKEYNRRIEGLEEVKSERGKRRKYKKKVPVPLLPSDFIQSHSNEETGGPAKSNETVPTQSSKE